jgi:hypothetical protein
MLFSAGIVLSKGTTNFTLMAEVGRPTDYTEDTPTKAQEYLDSCVDEYKQVVIGESEKFTSFKEKTIVRLPSIEGLARFLKISKDTIYEWEKIHPLFSDVLHALRSEQAQRLIDMGLSGDYNPVIARMLLSKHGYAERTELTGADGKAVITETHVKIIRDKTSGIAPGDFTPQSASGTESEEKV